MVIGNTGAKIQKNIKEKGEFMGHETINSKALAGPSSGESQFLHKSFQTMNQEMRGEAGLEQSASKRIGKYIAKLGDRILDPEKLRSEDWHDRFNEKYYAKVERSEVIRPENLEYAARSELQLEQRIGVDLGYDRLEVTPEAIALKSKEIVSNQKDSLRAWYDYLTSRDSSDLAYDAWFRYYAFRGMTTLGKYDKETGKFKKRDQYTAAPFPEINREALAMMFDVLKPSIRENGTIDGGKIPETCSADLKAAAMSGSFGNFYAAAIGEVDANAEVAQTFEGEWKKYNRSSEEEDAKVLFNDIHGKGTGWCTAGGLETARAHLGGGIFMFIIVMIKKVDLRFRELRFGLTTVR